MNKRDQIKKTSYLDLQRAQNLGIFLAGFKHRGDALTKKLSTIKLEDGGLKSGHIDSLIK